MGLLFHGATLLLTARPSPSGASLAVSLDVTHAPPQPPPALAPTARRITGPFHRVEAPLAALRAEPVLARGKAERLELGPLPDGRPLTLELTWVPGAP